MKCGVDKSRVASHFPHLSLLKVVSTACIEVIFRSAQVLSASKSYIQYDSTEYTLMRRVFHVDSSLLCHGKECENNDM